MIDEELATRLNFAGEIIRTVRSISGSDALSVLERDAASALIVSVPRERCQEILHALRELLIPRGYLPFRMDESYDEENPRDSIAILKTDDKFAPVRFSQTNGSNYDIGPAEVLAKLEDWDQRLGVTVLGAESDSLHVAFDHVPDYLLSFAEELYDFCPDLLDQGLEVMVDEAFEYLSEEQQAEVQARFDEDEGDEEGRAHRVALRMLAEEVAKTRAVFFWWD